MPTPFKIPAGSGLLAFGDSFTVGSNATSNIGYAQRLAARISGPFSNYAQGSTITTYSAIRGHQFLPVCSRKQAVSWMAGLNDIRAAGMAALQKIEGNLRSFIAASLLRQAVPASALKRTGTWTALPNTWGGKAFSLSGTPMYTSDINATLEYQFYGDTLVAGAYPTSGAGHYQDLEIIIDGGTPIIFALLGRTNETATYDAKVFQGLGDGLHTAIIRPINAIAHTVVDYVGTLVPRNSQPPVLISKIPYLLNWAQYNSIATQEIADAANAVIESVVAEFDGYGVLLVDPNTVYDPAVDCSSDGIHPTTAGHIAIEGAFSSIIDVA